MEVLRIENYLPNEFLADTNNKISTLNTTFSEGVYIHSNNEGGWGLLGGISGEVHRVEPFKGMNESSEGNGSPTN